jgi:galactose mutarotase-like enzyme
VFAIAEQEEQYLTYTLSDQAKDAHLQVVPARGGIITSWQVQGQELLYLDKERFAQPELSVRGGIPILFPICGNLPDNIYHHNNQIYSLKQHGFARDLPWQVKDKFTEKSAGITLVLNSNSFTKSLYPFDFNLSFTYQIKGNALEIFQRYTNLGVEPIPFSSGLHPYFLTQGKNQLRFDIPCMHYRDQKTGEIRENIGVFDSSLDEIDIAFENLTGLSTTAYDQARGLKITIAYSGAYTNLVFWTVKGKEFYCLEPWTGPRNAINTGDRLLYIEPGTSFDLVTRMSVNFL